MCPYVSPTHTVCSRECVCVSMLPSIMRQNDAVRQGMLAMKGKEWKSRAKGKISKRTGESGRKCTLMPYFFFVLLLLCVVWEGEAGVVLFLVSCHCIPSAVPFATSSNLMAVNENNGSNVMRMTTGSDRECSRAGECSAGTKGTAVQMRVRAECVCVLRSKPTNIVITSLSSAASLT